MSSFMVTTNSLLVKPLSPKDWVSNTAFNFPSMSNVCSARGMSVRISPRAHHPPAGRQDLGHLLALCPPLSSCISRRHAQQTKPTPNSCHSQQKTACTYLAGGHLTHLRRGQPLSHHTRRRTHAEPSLSPRSWGRACSSAHAVRQEVRALRHKRGAGAWRVRCPS